jgi:hypothetical protein
MRKLRIFALFGVLSLVAGHASPVGLSCGEGCQKCVYAGREGIFGTACEPTNGEHGQCSCLTLPSASGFGSACILFGSFCFGIVVRP